MKPKKLIKKLKSKQSRSMSIKLLSVMFIGMSVLMTTACSPLTRLSKVEVPANLMQPAPPLQELSGTTGKDFMKWAVDTVDKHNQCAIQVDAWIEVGKALK